MTTTTTTSPSIFATIADAVAAIRAVLAIPYPARTAEQNATVDAARAALATFIGRPATVDVRIAGETRAVALRWFPNGLRATSTEIVALARVGRSGAKLWPTALDVFVTDAGRLHVNMSVRIAGQRSDGMVCYWADDTRAAAVVSKSIHAHSDAGAASRAKSAATRKATRTGER